MPGFVLPLLLTFNLLADTFLVTKNHIPISPESGLKNSANRIYYANQDSAIHISRAGSPFEGIWEWEKNDLDRNFVLNIRKEGAFLKGTYCCVMQKGAKVDCPIKKEVSFVAPLPGVTSFTTYFKSAYSELDGQVKITFDGFNILWEVLDKPKGESYIPTTAVLIKQQ